MKILGLFQYAYLVFAVLFAYDAITTPERRVMSGLLAALAIFMFFFRKRFRKKFEDQNKK